MSGSTSFFKAVTSRRTIYQLSASSPIPDSRILDIVNESVKHSPSSFNSQSSRAVVLFGEEHKKLWDFAKEAVKAVSPAERWTAAEARLNGFQNAYGTVLLFEDRAVIEALQEKIPNYADKDHGHGILAYVLWTAFAEEGLGANLQHYSPLIDAKIQSTWEVPVSWELKAQLVFGKPEGAPGPKEFSPLETRVKSFGSK
ncbi:uncharacterized protein P7C70_g259, partial [Phenoliferia sp. Uapishka_3]